MKRLWLLLFTLAATPLAAAPHPPRGPRIEVAFVLDVTGSMQSYIDMARARIAGIAADLASGEPQPEVRFALVEFRDRGDAFVTRVHPFSAKLATMQGGLDAAKADGGGDTPEAVLEGLKDGITKLDWTADPSVTKLLYLVGDAPPQHYPDSPTEAWITAEALERGIVIHSIAVGSMDAAGAAEFEALARLTEGRPYRLSDAAPSASRPTASLGAAVTSTARAYSAASGVKYEPGKAPPIVGVPVPLPAGAGQSGLLGAQLRVIRDERGYADLLAAHASLGLPAPRMPIDFSRSQLLVLGGADAGLALVRLERGDGGARATVRGASPGVRFILVPADTGPVVAAEVMP